MIDVGLQEPVAKDNALALAWMADGDCDYVTDDVPQILGRSLFAGSTAHRNARRRSPGAGIPAPWLLQQVKVHSRRCRARSSDWPERFQE